MQSRYRDCERVSKVGEDMYLGKVIGTVVSTVKSPSLTGCKFLIVEKINQDLTAKKQTEVSQC